MRDLALQVKVLDSGQRRRSYQVRKPGLERHRHSEKVDKDKLAHSSPEENGMVAWWDEGKEAVLIRITTLDCCGIMHMTVKAKH